MAAKADCYNLFRENSRAIENAFLNGNITLQDAKIRYQREIDSYRVCSGGDNSLNALRFNPPSQTVFTSNGTFARTSNGSVVYVNNNAARYNRMVRSCLTCNRA